MSPSLLWKSVKTKINISKINLSLSNSLFKWPRDFLFLTFHFSSRASSIFFFLASSYSFSFSSLNCGLREKRCEKFHGITIFFIILARWRRKAFLSFYYQVDGGILLQQFNSNFFTLWLNIFLTPKQEFYHT